MMNPFDDVYFMKRALQEAQMAFDKNEENGPFEEYHPNGKIKAKGTYLAGDNEHGLLEIFDDKGELIKKMQCKKGVCRTTWKKEDSTNSKKI